MKQIQENIDQSQIEQKCTGAEEFHYFLYKMNLLIKLWYTM